MINSQTIAILAKENMLKENFYKIFLDPTTEYFNELKIDGSHINFYSKKRFFKIYKLFIRELDYHANDINRELDVMNDSLSKLLSIDIYYENLSKTEFLAIINMLRSYYLERGVFINPKVIESIVNLYYGENIKASNKHS
ncbi:hypothetical protein SAMN05660493_01541 [Epilithonimonas bovis DSM 19482]|uniref:Uncharacterized protein n=1 Tax=Epilithonimonas bovis DSM 19482 TaxID=1121284 RepID=A0A1U7PTF1_9FLAO|nr:hypothetical protein [Epilithonimonas bovis]SIT96846.1 hypothetical protein SAMN05660493_01541 [Epilithonimonas bovis DSM 19482]